MEKQIDQKEELLRDILDSAFVSEGIAISLAIDLAEKGWCKVNRSAKTKGGERL